MVRLLINNIEAIIVLIEAEARKRDDEHHFQNYASAIYDVMMSIDEKIIKLMKKESLDR